MLIPEPLCDHLPVAGRGQACWEATIRRPGPPVHEVMRPADEPSVIAAGAELVARLGRLDERLAADVRPRRRPRQRLRRPDPRGEIYNQFPQECRLEGTRRWVPGTDRREVEREFRGLVAELARGLGHDDRPGLSARPRRLLPRPGASRSSPTFQAGLRGDLRAARCPLGPKPFVDDGNSFWALAGVPAITHGPRAGGQHTVEEWASIDDLVRVAHLYALTATLYCPRD